MRLSLARLLREAAWAPLAVLVLTAIVVRLPNARELWWPLHVFGGAALAFFFFQAIGIAGSALQEGLVDTMVDLVFGLSGAAAALALLYASGRR